MFYETINESLRKNSSSSSYHAGFSLIELIIVMVIIGVLASIGFYSFVNYNNAQRLSLETKSLESTLNLARSRAQSQVKPAACGNEQLRGYKVRFFLTEPTKQCFSDKCYDLAAYCGVNDVAIPNTVRSFPDEIEIIPAQVEYLFQVLNQGVKDIPSSGSVISISGYNQTYFITVFPSGSISVQKQ